jgi:hypothetical protein
MQLCQHHLGGLCHMQRRLARLQLALAMIDGPSHDSSLQVVDVGPSGDQRTAGRRIPQGGGAREDHAIAGTQGCNVHTSLQQRLHGAECLGTVRG